MDAEGMNPRESWEDFWEAAGRENIPQEAMVHDAYLKQKYPKPGEDPMLYGGYKIHSPVESRDSQGNISGWMVAGAAALGVLLGGLL